MYQGITFPTEGLTTHITFKGILPTTHVLTSFDIVLFAEWFITVITAASMHLAVISMMFLQSIPAKNEKNSI
jgi:hypothetical protein